MNKQREFKFRVWDTEKFLYTDLSQRLSNDTGGFPYLRFNLSHYFKQPGFEFIIQQYTGIKDINKKEIYEGDIIEVNLGTEQRYLGKIGFAGCIYWFYGKISYPLSEVQNIEVKGNIFENPELCN